MWLLIFGLVLLVRDSVTALASLTGFLMLTAWGIYLWISRARLSAYAGIRRFLAGGAIVVAIVTTLANERGVSAPPRVGESVSTFLPYSVVPNSARFI